MNPRRYLLAAACSALFTVAGGTGAAFAETNPYLGQMNMVGQSWCPVNWAPMDGQHLPISSNQSLYALLGCTYGGDCRTTMALPDMRGRTPVGMGQRPGLSNYQLGESGGSETVTLTLEHLPPHTHYINASDRAGSSPSPGGRDFADFTGTAINGYTSFDPGGGQIMAPQTIGLTGDGQPFSIRQPYQVINYCIAVKGRWPMRRGSSEEE